MMNMDLLEQAKEVTSHFCMQGEAGEICSWGSGHINDTFLVQAQVRYILQRMNRSIFERPVDVMENITNVTSFLKEKIKKPAVMNCGRRLRLFSAKMGTLSIRMRMGITGACII